MPTYQLKNWEMLTWMRDKDKRIYHIILHQDLWGNWIVTRAWGRAGTKQGGTKDHAISYEEAIGLIAKLSKKRKYRKYHEINSQTN
jgi:predicted DNA-binding WGR domain protein